MSGVAVAGAILVLHLLIVVVGVGAEATVEAGATGVVFTLFLFNYQSHGLSHFDG